MGELGDKPYFFHSTIVDTRSFQKPEPDWRAQNKAQF